MSTISISIIGSGGMAAAIGGLAARAGHVVKRLRFSLGISLHG
jgi:hypothetical protein